MSTPQKHFHTFFDRDLPFCGLRDHVESSQAAIEAAVLAERERCAVLVERLTVRKRWARMASTGAKDIVPCALAAAIRLGVKS